MNEQEKFKKERQQPSQKLGHYTLGARCECGHTYQKHQLGVCIHCECKEFRYIRHPLTPQAKAQLKAIVPFKEKIIEGFTIKMYPITSDKKLSYSKFRQLLEKLDECGIVRIKTKNTPDDEWIIEVEL